MPRGVTRKTRESTIRRNTVVHDEHEDFNFEPPGLLDAPEPRPGYVQRWIRTLANGSHDPRNRHKATLAGWKPRDPGSLPAKWSSAPTHNSELGHVIGVEGMVLMERPVELHRRYAQRNLGQVSHNMKAIEGALEKQMGGEKPMVTRRERKAFIQED